MYKNPRAQITFLNRGGLSLLCSCLRDENQTIKTASLQILAMFVSEFPELKFSNNNIHIVRDAVELVDTLSGSLDKNAQTLDIALRFLAQISKNKRIQDFARECNIFTVLDSLFSTCVEMTASDQLSTTQKVYTLIESVCSCLNNLSFRNSQNQDLVRDFKFIESCLSLIRDKTVPTHVCECVLNVLANFTDTNQANQDLLGTEAVKAFIERFLLFDENEQLQDMTCLLLSHLTWNHPKNQNLFGTKQIVERLLRSIHRGELYALLCLTNMLYQNTPIQDFVHELGGIHVLVKALDTYNEYVLVLDTNEIAT